MKQVGALLFVLVSAFSLRATELTVAVFDFEPWQMVRGDKAFGINVEFLDELGTRAGFQPQYFKCPLIRCLRLAKNGQVDLVIDLFQIPERQQYLIYLQPAMKRGGYQAFYYSSDAPLKILNYEDLSALKVGHIKSAKYFDRFDQDLLLQKLPYTRQEQLFLALSKHRIDVFVGNESSVDYMLKKQSLDRVFVKAKYKVAIAQHGYLVMSKKSRHLDMLPQIEKVLSELKEADYLNFVLQKYQ